MEIYTLSKINKFKKWLTNWLASYPQDKNITPVLYFSQCVVKKTTCVLINTHSSSREEILKLSFSGKLNEILSKNLQVPRPKMEKIVIVKGTVDQESRPWSTEIKWLCWKIQQKFVFLQIPWICENFLSRGSTNFWKLCKIIKIRNVRT